MDATETDDTVTISNKIDSEHNYTFIDGRASLANSRDGNR